VNSETFPSNFWDFGTFFRKKNPLYPLSHWISFGDHHSAKICPQENNTVSSIANKIDQKNHRFLIFGLLVCGQKYKRMIKDMSFLYGL
jgi:hypothetical protein